MGDSVRSGDDRLPWLDAPRPPAKPAPAARRARTPLLALLGLFFFSAIAVMAYLAGRTIMPLPTPAPAARTASPTPPIPVPTPPPAAPIVTTSAPPVAAPIRAEPAKPRATPPKVRPKARRSTPRPARAVAVDRVRTLPKTYVAPRPPIIWPSRPFAGPRGRVIQLGTYRTQSQADAAWWQVARAYPYLATLPRVVTAVGPTPGRARYHQVRLAAGSRREARALCKYLRRIGRGCVIV